MALLIALVVFITLLVIVALCYNYVIDNGYTINSRIEQYVQKKPLETPAPFVPILPKVPSKFNLWNFIVTVMGKYLGLLKWSQLIEHKLTQGALPIRGVEFIVICVGTGMVGAFVFFLLAAQIILTLIGGMVGFCIPFLILKMKIDQRKQAFNDQLGDTMVLIANALRTGYSFMQAVDMVSREMPRPIGEDFARVLKELNLGVTTETALTNMAKRVNSEDLDLVITAVLIQRQVGGNLAVVLDSIANTIRERIKIKGQIRTLTAQGKISGIIIGLLPIVIGGVIYVINPEYINVLVIHPMGKAMLIAGAMSQFIGMMVIRKIINIDI